jgi:hypothetical protein
MKIINFIPVVLIVSCFTLFTNCKKENESKISSYGDNKSHNSGQNCMNCHKQGGSGDGLFQIAGTVYNSTFSAVYSDATIKLYTEANGAGTLKYTIEGDVLGNFYTTENIDFGSGLFVAVQGNSATHYMSSIISTGQCNSCHSGSTGKIWAE